MHSPQVPNHLLPGLRPLTLFGLELVTPDGRRQTLPDGPPLLLRALSVHRRLRHASRARQTDLARRCIRVDPVLAKRCSEIGPPLGNLGFPRIQTLPIEPDRLHHQMDVRMCLVVVMGVGVLSSSELTPNKLIRCLLELKSISAGRHGQNNIESFAARRKRWNHITAPRLHGASKLGHLIRSARLYTLLIG